MGEFFFIQIAESLKMTKLLANMSINLKVKSIGWCLENSVGGVPGEILPVSPEAKPEKSAIFSKEFKNFGRLDKMSKAVCTAVAFALKGAGLYPHEEKQPISLFFNNKTGCAESDKAFFEDFVEFGETAGRANLFLYTLPTSPLGEASVHFGLTGDIAYFATSDRPLPELLEAAADACEFRNSSGEKLMLIGLGEINGEAAETIFLLVANNGQAVENSETILEMTDFHNLKTYISGEIIK